MVGRAGEEVSWLGGEEVGLLEDEDTRWLGVRR